MAISDCSEQPALKLGGGEGVPQLVGHHVAEPGLGGGAAQLGAERLGGDSPAVVGEQEVGGLASTGMAQRPACGPVPGDRVDQGDGVVVEGHHPLGGELAERDLQPGALAGDLVHAVQLEAGELTDAHPGGSEQEERVSAEPVRGGC